MEPTQREIEGGGLQCTAQAVLCQLRPKQGRGVLLFVHASRYNRVAQACEGRIAA